MEPATAHTAARRGDRTHSRLLSAELNSAADKSGNGLGASITNRANWWIVEHIDGHCAHSDAVWETSCGWVIRTLSDTLREIAFTPTEQPGVVTATGRVRAFLLPHSTDAPHSTATYRLTRVPSSTVTAATLSGLTPRPAAVGMLLGGDLLKFADRLIHAVACESRDFTTLPRAAGWGQAGDRDIDSVAGTIRALHGILGCDKAAIRVLAITLAKHMRDTPHEPANLLARAVAVKAAC